MRVFVVVLACFLLLLGQCKKNPNLLLLEGWSSVQVHMHTVFKMLNNVQILKLSNVNEQEI